LRATDKAIRVSLKVDKSSLSKQRRKKFFVTKKPSLKQASNKQQQANKQTSKRWLWFELGQPQATSEISLHKKTTEKTNRSAIKTSTWFKQLDFFVFWLFLKTYPNNFWQNASSDRLAKHPTGKCLCSFQYKQKLPLKLMFYSMKSITWIFEIIFII